MRFDLPKDLPSIIKVIGVGGGGSNAVNHMHEQGIKGVDFIVCNTDRQALDMSPIATKLQLGTSLTEGLGAGSVPERGKDCALENIDDIRNMLNDRTKMVFITAGMGGGTGTGAAPVIAATAKEMGVLTVGIVTVPFNWEGRKRRQQAMQGIQEMRDAVDTLIIINNDRLRDLFGNLTLDNAFEHADNVLSTAARGIAEIMTMTGKVNVDFEDVKTVMTGSGVAIMGMSEAEGEDRALNAAKIALESPLLNDNDISGAKYVLLNITHGDKEVLMDEITEITDHIQEAAGDTADVIWGYCHDPALGEKMRVTVIATGYDHNPDTGIAELHRPEKKKIPLDIEMPTMITKPITSPLQQTHEQPEEKTKEEKGEANEPYLKPAAEQEEEEQPTLQFELPKPPVAPVVPEPQPTMAEEPAPAPIPEKKVFSLDDEPVAQAEPANDNDLLHTDVSPQQHQQRVEQRQARIREISLKLRTPNGLNDLEKEPAYKRRNVALSNVPHSSESNVSRYTLTEGEDELGERTTELKRNNPYLHDNVD